MPGGILHALNVSEAGDEKGLVRGDLQSGEQLVLVMRRSPGRVRASLVLVVAFLTALLSAAMCAAAILAPAPAPAVPLVVAVCIGCPLFAGWEVPVAVASLRADRAGGRALARLRRTLEQLPETEHPLGL
ncbi:MAG: hypothetical protein JO262_19910 [Solirubrobacterales bacterium]|nr:hypothetical protein [Solirubrobacterales bacterium]MBV9944404.1 hypothetical protein [Solirubrobacterales bacterium]